MDPPGRLAPPADAYLTPAGILRAAAGLARERGGRIVGIGESREGRTISAFRFGPEAKGGVLLISLLHACEWIGALTLLAVAERITRERADIPLTMIPIANPDGAARAEESVARNRPRLVRGNARGCDLNRNFPVGHRAGGLMSLLPWYRPGSHPESEPETAACAGIARAIRPAIALSFHSFGRWIFYPPSSTMRSWELTAAHAEILERAGRAGSIGYRSRQLGRWAWWFRAYGTEIDFLTGEVGALSYLIELSRGGILRWGVRRLIHPFFWYNPPRPKGEIERVAEFCARLVSEGMREPPPRRA
jgi:predicted deacylase